MQELLRNAVNGWQRYTDDGKYAVLLLGILLFYWYLTRSDSKIRTQNRELLWKYTVLTAGMAIFPLTAVILMKYQTRFYNYEWIWSAVPVTLVIAAGMTGIYLECYEKYWNGKLLKPAGLIAAGLALIFLCGDLGNEWEQGTFEASGKEKAALVVDKVRETGDTDDICMWGPSEILQYVRGLDGGMKLLYGRNMWDEALNAYAYDTYAPELYELYEWMELLDDETAADGAQEETAGDDQKADTESVNAESKEISYLQIALQYGVNCIVLPQGSTAAESFERLAEKNNLQLLKLQAEGYDIFRLQPAVAE